jgi:hypothetical protein
MNMQHEQIQERAYALWIEEGRVHGRADDYWLRAERELNHGVKAAPAEANANLPKTKTAAVRRRASRKRAA